MTKQAIIDALLREIVYLNQRDSILCEAMAEVKVTDEGESQQPISVIVAGCIGELAEIHAPVPPKPVLGLINNARYGSGAEE